MKCLDLTLVLVMVNGRFTDDATGTYRDSDGTELIQLDRIVPKVRT